MTFDQTFSLVLLAVVFAVSIWRKANIGLVAYAATLLLALVTGADPVTALDGFPAGLVVLIIGVTLLFAHAEHSGAVDWAIGLSLRGVGERRWLVPWLGFTLGVVLASVGGFPTAVMAVVIPVVARLAATFGMPYAMMAVACALGTNAAGFSPLSTSGALLRTLTAKEGLTYSPWALFALVLGLQTLLALLVFGFSGGVRAARGGAATTPVGPSPVAVAPMTAYRAASLGALAVFVIVAVGFDVDVGLTATALALVLQLAFRPEETTMLRRVPWSVVLVISGLLVYLAALERLGTLTAIEHALGAVAVPALAVLALAYITALVSNMESSTLVVLGVTVPVGLGLAHLSGPVLLGVLVTISMSAAVVVVSPVHMGGALTLANAPHEDQRAIFTRLLVLSGVFTALVPGLTALFPILSGL